MNGIEELRLLKAIDAAGDYGIPKIAETLDRFPGAGLSAEIDLLMQKGLVRRVDGTRCVFPPYILTAAGVKRLQGTL